ncbi:MAG: hypothetical protein EBU97_07125, partial [Rhodobacteraceae bacterium]|nr:hypothetical protein [Paracoccaceae bacterium]
WCLMHHKSARRPSGPQWFLHNFGAKSNQSGKKIACKSFKKRAPSGVARNTLGSESINPRPSACVSPLESIASGNPALPDWLGPLAFDRLSTASSQNDAYARQIRSSAGIAVFTGARADPAHWVAVGQACQRFALQATALGLKHAFINQAVEVADLRPQLASLVGLPGRRPDIVMRFGYGATLPYAARRPVDDVLA